MKELIYLILKKIKIDNLKLLRTYVKFKINITIDSHDYIDTYFQNIEELEETVDSVVKYLDCKNQGILFNISKLKKNRILLSRLYITRNMEYILNIEEIHLRILNKILIIKDRYKLLEAEDGYHSRNLKTHIIYIESYLDTIFK